MKKRILFWAVMMFMSSILLVCCGTGSDIDVGGKHNGHAYVDLGLPSGLLWATCNVGADNPEDYGNYYAWGETTTKSNYSWSTYKYSNGDSDENGFFAGTILKYNTDNYYGTVDNKTVLDQEDDAAHVNWGGDWRMPTAEEMDELINNCTTNWVTINGVYGYKVTSNINGNYIFLPAAGDRDGSSSGGDGSFGYYWSSSLSSVRPASAGFLIFNSSFFRKLYVDRFLGYSVRAVCENPVVRQRNFTVTVIANDAVMGSTKGSGTCNGYDKVTITATANEGYFFSSWNDGSRENPRTIVVTSDTTIIANFETWPESGNENNHAYVDLGLPSGLLWATCNVGAENPEDYGNYYAWGETETKGDYSWSTYKYSNGDFDESWNFVGTILKYNTSADYGTVDNKTVLDLEDDAAHVNWGGAWRMPTDAEIAELRENCTWQWTIINGKNGYKVTSIVEGNTNYIFLPAAGYRDGGYLYYDGSYGSYVWSSSLYSDYPGYARYLYFDSSVFSSYYYYRYLGRSVRAVCHKIN